MTSYNFLIFTAYRDGSIGVIHIVHEISNLSDILENGTAEYYIPVMNMLLLSYDVGVTLKASSKISGLVLFKDNSTLISRYSHDAKCPNSKFTLNDTCEVDWNSPGTDLLYYDFSFPILYMSNQNQLQTLTDCFNKFNNFSVETHRDRSLCSLELRSFMFSTTDTPTCLR